MYVDMCANMCIDMCKEMCMDMCIYVPFDAAAARQAVLTREQHSNDLRSSSFKTRSSIVSGIFVAENIPEAAVRPVYRHAY